VKLIRRRKSRRRGMVSVEVVTTIAVMLPRFLSLHFFNSRAGIEVQIKAIRVREMG